MSKGVFKDKMRNRRQYLGLSQEELACKIGSSKQVISTYETGARIPKVEMADKIARALDVSIDYLMGNANSISDIPEGCEPIKGGTYVPLYGRIACGSPILALEESEEVAWMPDDICADFALTCVGDSMINARIFDGDIVYIRKQPTVNNGEIAAVMVNDEEVTLKRVYYYQNESRLVLRAENPTFPDQKYYDEELNHITILGKAVAFLAQVR